MANEIITEDGEVVTTDVLLPDTVMAGTLARAEIDMQIATARQYPRSIKRAIDSILTLATLDEETAVECIYALKRDGKPIRGPSIRMAEIIVTQWGNNRSGAQVISIDRTNKLIVAEGFFHDLESNSATRATVQRRISNKYGKLYNDDMIATTGNAACSIAKRNAILAGVPKGIWRKAVEAAEQIIRGDAKTLVERRDTAIKAFAHFNLSPDQVFAIMDVSGIEDIELDDLVTLRAIYSSLKNGEQTVEELLRGKQTGPTHTPVSDPLNDDGPAPKSGTTKTEAKPAPAGAATEAAGGSGAAPAPTPAAAPAEPASSDAAQTAATSQSGPDPDDERDPPTAAYLAGREARKNGISGRTVPEEFASDETSAADWSAGWKEENAAQKAGGGK